MSDPPNAMDNSTFEATVVLTALRSDAGQLLDYIKLIHNISSRLHAEREREDMLCLAGAALAD